MSDFILHLGDCLDPVTGLASLADKSVDHVITDPPYEAEAHTLQRRVKRAGWRNTESSDDRAIIVRGIDFAPIAAGDRVACASGMVRVGRRWVIAFCQAEAIMPWRESFVSAGGIWKRAMIWIKPDGMPQLTGDRPGVGYESMAVAHAPGRCRWNGGGKHGVYTFSKNSQVEATGHPTQKPVALLEALIRDFTDPGETILDPFAGSGTTGVAAIRLGRKFVGFEKDPKYHAIALRRLQNAREQLTMFEKGATP